MLKKLILALLGLAAVAAGVTMFAAFTAQIVNLTAHVEKEIEFSAVENCDTDPVTGDIVCDATDGDYGTVIPQEEYDKLFEVTLSESFRNNEDQTRFGDVHFDLLWECKQFDDLRDVEDNLTGDPGPDGWPDCRVDDDLDHDGDGDVDDDDVKLHADGYLDGYLGDYVSLVSGEPSSRCEIGDTHTDKSIRPAEKYVEFIFHGNLIDGVNDESGKCFYTVKLLAPPCSDSFNPFTDPNGPDVDTVDCHFWRPTDDPQDWEHFADIGDDLKVQVTFHSQR